MKTLILILAMVIMMGLARQTPTKAQDVGFEAYSYQANPLCVMRVTVTAGEVGHPVQALLQWGETIMQSADLGSGESVDLLIQMDIGWYLVIVHRDEADKDAYSIDSGLMCGEDGIEAGHDAPQPSPRLMDELKPAIESMKSLLQSLMKTQ